ncbi:MAG: phosphate regulon sensor histidine kinase PhoR [Alphaproteobacteria bacterium]|nr:phosphate regulon sensor histidine kinase PhoR [Alphaproteobacteria bacterium]
MPKTKHLLAIALALSLPGMVVLIILITSGALPAGPGVIGIVVVVTAGATLVIRPLARLREISTRLESLIDQPPDQEADILPPDDFGPIGDVAANLFRLERNWGRDRRMLRDNLHAAQILFDALPDPLITLDAESRLVYANTAARELLEGRNGTGDLIGRNLSAVIRQPAIHDAVAEVLEGKPSRAIEFNFADRVDQFLEARVEPIQANTESVDGARVLILMHDVTALRRGEQLRADFVANVSHELRTPLTSLVGFFETLRSAARDDPDAQARFLDLMEDQSTRMTRIVNDLLSLSRIEMNEHTPPSDEVDLGQTIGTVADLLAPQAAAHDATIQLDMGNLDRPVVGQSDELTQLFQNLIENAIKYGGSGSIVRVEAEVQDDTVSVSVIDQGDGIPREHLPRLTERFYRVDTARSRELGGTGLGLAIVKHIANRHRGELSIQSQPGVGSTFTVTLQLATP